MEHETHNWPWEKHGSSKPQIVIVWPCDLLIVIANAKRIGNWKSLNGIGESEGIIGIRGRSTSSWNFSLQECFMASRVPLHNFGAFKFRSKIIGEPIFNRKLCGGIPGKSSEFYRIDDNFIRINNSVNRFECNFITIVVFLSFFCG